MADERTEISSLYNRAIEVVLQQRINEKNDNLNVHHLPDRIIHDLLAECLSFVPKSNNSSKLEKPVRKYSARKLRIFFNKITLNVWVRLLRHEAYRKTLVQFYQRLYNYDSNESTRGGEARVNEVIVKSFQELTFESDVDQRGNEANLNEGIVESFHELSLESNILKHIDHGLILGSFFSETSWYDVSEGILRHVTQLCRKLPENHIATHISQLECYQRLFHTYTMFFKFDKAAVIKDEIEVLRTRLEQCEHQVNYALLFTEYSRYNFLKSNYEESHAWIQRAMSQLHDKLPVSVIIDVLKQASKVCVVKRDLDKAKDLIHQALGRAYQYYGPESYKLAALLPDFGFYLLYFDQIVPCVTVYREAYSLRKKMFDHSNNLLVAIAEEDLAYALYVKEYSSGEFDLAMKHAEQAISTMKKLLPPGNLMLASANRVKALILEELAIDTYTNQQQDGLVNMDMLEEAERLHKGALKLTKHTFGEENILTAKHYGNLGRLYQSMRKYEEAEKMHLKAIQIKEKILGKNDYEVGLSVGHLASLYNYHMQKYEQAEVLYRRSININLKLFSEAYSGLEYDYRGLIHVYEQLSDDEQYLKYTHKLHRWNDLRKIHASENIGSNFYENIKIKPLKEILNLYRVGTSSICQDRESNQSENRIENILRF